MAVSAADWDRRIAAGLKGCSRDARDYFDEMRRELEQLLSTVSGSAEGGRTVIPPESLAAIAQRTRVGTDRCLAELRAPRRGLVEIRTTGVHLPLVARAFFRRRFEAESARRSYQSRKGLRGVEKGLRRVETFEPPTKAREIPEENRGEGVEKGVEISKRPLPPAPSPTPAPSPSPTSPIPIPTPAPISTPQPGPSGGAGLFGAVEGPKAAKRPPPRPDPAEIPAPLDVPAFRAAWADWERHRREIHETLTPTTRQRQLAKLEKFGVAGAVASIERSIENGWTGLFDPPTPRNPDHGNHSHHRNQDRQPAPAARRAGEFAQPHRPLPRFGGSGAKAGHG